MKTSALEKTAAAGESETLEFKKSTGQLGRAGESLSGFLNGRGGRVVVGVTPAGVLVGQHVSDKTRREIAAMLDRFEPPAPVEVEYVALPESERQVVLLDAPALSDARPFTFGGRPYQRVETTTSVMPQERCEALLLERAHARRRWENQPAVDVGLDDLERKILTKLGRGGDALASAWEDYRRAPSVYSYENLMKFVPKGERPEWHAKAMAALTGAGLSSRIDLFVKTKEWARLAEVVEESSRADLEGLSHLATEPAAKKLTKSHPLLAAKLYVAMALRIVDAKKSKYYYAALGNLETARKLMFAAEAEEEWAALAAEIRMAHGRKSSFMPGFERLDEGRSMKEPSFRDRARRCWAKGAGRKRRT